jgi:outer membrane protein assembly factor BamB
MKRNRLSLTQLLLGLGIASPPIAVACATPAIVGERGGSTSADGGLGVDGGTPTNSDGGAGGNNADCSQHPDAVGCGCAKAGDTRACWPGDPAKRGVGGCHDGTQTCTIVGSGDVYYVLWGACQGATTACDGGDNPVGLPEHAWPRIRHDNRNTGTTTAVVAAMPRFKWKVAFDGVSSPAVSQNNVIFINGASTSRFGPLLAFDSTGKPVYTFDATNQCGAVHCGAGEPSPLVRADGVAYVVDESTGVDANGNPVGDASAVVFAVDSTGHALWSHPYPAASSSDADPIVTTDGTIILGSDDGSVYALDPMGKLLWKTDPRTGPGEIDSALAQSPKGYIVAGGTHGWFALDLKTGTTLWSVANAIMSIYSTPLVELNGTIYGVDDSQTAYAIDANGGVLWKRQLVPSVVGNGELVHVDHSLFVLANDGSLRALDDATGNDLWARPIGNGSGQSRLPGPVVDGAKHLYIQSQDGYLYSFDTAGNQLWRLPTSGKATATDFIGNIAIGYDGTLYVPGNDGYLYAFQ